MNSKKVSQACAMAMDHVYLGSVWTPVVMLLLLLIASRFICIHSQLDSHGFISIDCGYTGPEYDLYSLTFVADVGFTDEGSITDKVDVGNMQPNLLRRYQTVRFFPKGTRSCYRLHSLTPGTKYLVMAAFGYGNYDAQNRPPVFDLYVGVNYWTTVNITDASRAYVFDKIAVSPAEYLHVCLVNIGLGIPFISGLDLRSLPANLYPEANVTQSLVLLSFFRDTVGFGSNRYHFGTDEYLIRYRDDRYDRIWHKFEDNHPNWIDVRLDKVDGTVQNSPNDTYNAPSVLMRSAFTPVNASRMDLSWSSDASIKVGVDTNYLVLLYFAEVVAIRENELREFDVILDDTPLVSAFRPRYMFATVLSGTVQGSGQHNISLLNTKSSTLPPLISAMEIYLLRPLNESSTDSLDANAMMAIQTKYSVKRNWAGDPCAPIAFAWDGLNCSYTPRPSGPPRITALNLSFSGLIGEIDSSFGQLALLQHLDLSRNNLSGSIPDFLGQMPSLTFVDLSSNNLSGTVPTSLQEKSDSGVVILKTGNNPNLISNKKMKKTKLIAAIAVPGAATIALLLVLVIWKKTKLVSCYRKRKTKDVPLVANPFKHRIFKYKDLETITNGFQNVIGKGGYGQVYIGKLEDGTAVAVKVESQQISSQGNTDQFLAEVHHLTRVHHRNLLSLIGYCEDKKHRCLVYEYMDGGTLEDRLRGQEDPPIEPLTWLQRLNIALGSASGLEYLHKSCSTPLIHRDVKTQNILLNANLEAKISDFGLTRSFSRETETHTVTQPAGTPGYLDPEYYASYCLSEKSDVYSFGVVLLVLITAQPAIIPMDPINSSEREHITEWVRERLSEGHIESVADRRIRGDCDLNSVLKVAELALHCTERVGRDRPTMTEVVEALRESLQLETTRRSSQPLMAPHTQS